MEDHEIVGLYWARAENAVAETAAKYGSWLRRTAGRVLRSPRTARSASTTATWPSGTASPRRGRSTWGPTPGGWPGTWR